jgi:hypothetical protein
VPDGTLAELTQALDGLGRPPRKTDARPAA